MTSVVRLQNDAVRVDIDAQAGAEFRSFVDLKTKREIVPSWTAAGGEGFAGRYRGGWQEVIPNGGPPSEWNGVRYGQHGVVCEQFWTVERSDSTSATFSTTLGPIPIHLTKTVSIAQRGMRVEETVENHGASSESVMWGQHLAFASPFLDSRGTFRIEDGVRVIPHAGPLAGGGRIAADREYEFPHAVRPDGQYLDLRRVPERGEPTGMAYLTGFREGWFELHSGTGGGVRVEWEPAVYPYLWLWQESGATTDHPWFGRGYVMGIEPFSSYPSEGLPTAVANGTALTIGAGASITTTWSVTTFGGLE